MSGDDPFVDALQEWVEESMHRSIHAFIRFNRQSALSLSQINALFRLYHRGTSPVSDLADHLGISTPAVSQLLAPLEDTGLIVRTEDPSDRRVKRIAITEKGSQRVEESMQARHAWLDDLAALIPPDEKAALLPFLVRLNEYSQALNEKLGHHHQCANATMKLEA
jgi:DNA-binding MarR family transcriptional regulator